MEKFEQIAVAATAAAGGRGVLRVLKGMTPSAESEAYQEACMAAWEVLHRGGSEKRAYRAAEKAAKGALKKAVLTALSETPAGLIGA